MYAYMNRRLSKNKGAPRVWIEGAQPARGGYEPGTHYSVSVDRDKKTVMLSVTETGRRVVSSKEKGGRRIPVIDINSREILEIFEGFEVVRVIVRDRRIFIVPSVAEIKRVERLERLTRKQASGEPLQIGSVAHGIGVLAHALHAGLRDEGVRAEMAFANDIREDLLEQSSAQSGLWGAKAQMLAAPMQELAMDRWALDKMPSVDVLEGGLSYSGASVAGRAKRGTECAEAHPEVGALVVPFIQLAQALNPNVILLENVPPYQSTASMWILRNALRDMGYEVHETILDAAEFNELEGRKRLCMVAVTRGIAFDFAEIEIPPAVARRLGEVLEDIPEDDPAWSGFEYLKRHQEKHAAKGNGFQMQVFDAESDHIGTITKGYAKIRSTDPKIAHPTNPELMRQLSPAEHSACKGIPASLVEGMSKTAAHEGLGQSVCYAPFRAVGRLLANALKRPVDFAARTLFPDLLSAA